jgi:hypothetical protein
MVDKPSQPQIFNTIPWVVAFWDVENQLLKELFLNRVVFFVKETSIEKNNKFSSWFNLLLFKSILLEVSMVVKSICAWYKTKIVKCFDATCEFMALVPWFLLHITRPLL